MFKIKSIITLLGISFILQSCQTNAENINISDLKTPCDLVDAINSLVSEAEKIKGDHKIKDLTIIEKDKYDRLKRKFREIADLSKSREFNVKKEDVINCEGFREDFKKRIKLVEFD